jgi:hypothetical protein
VSVFFTLEADIAAPNHCRPRAYGFSQNDATMSAVLGETDYTSTGFPNHNLVPNGYYCAGCNGSFQLGFTTTSVGDASGVFGVGIDILSNSQSLPYHAFVTFGDASTIDYLLPGAGTFWGINSPLNIASIDFGLINGGTTVSGSFAIDNLTIGSAAVPAPATLALFGLGLAGLGWSRRKKA